MNELEALVVMVALFSLQCIAPLAIILVLGHLMGLVMAHWLGVTEPDALGDTTSNSLRSAPDTAFCDS